MQVSEFSKLILNSPKLLDKLEIVDQISFDKSCLEQRVKLPTRDIKHQLTNKQIRFPKGHFHLDEKKAIALNSFANHELLAIEIMAQMLLYFPHDTEEMKRFKRGIFKALKDEQKHCRMYIQRLNEIGYEFGDFPLNDFFWRQSFLINNPSEYLSIMSVTFEGANLDFALEYEKIFRSVDDIKTSEILKEVYEDELSHVAFGTAWLNRWRNNKSLWQYYLENLPWPLTPARAKGKTYDEDSRVKSNFSQDFIEQLKNFSDDFNVTNRREWK